MLRIQQRLLSQLKLLSSAKLNTLLAEPLVHLESVFSEAFWQRSQPSTLPWQTNLHRCYSVDGTKGDGENTGSSAEGTNQTRATQPSPADSSAVVRATVSSRSPGDAIDAALDQWGRAMDEGDWETAWDIFESQFPVEGTPQFPSLTEILAWDPDDDDKSLRRQRELELQQEYANARVQKIDDMGRAHGVGKRKTSVARVWIKQGNGLMMINRRPFDEYFPALPRRNDMIAPFVATNTLGKFDVMAAVHGGGHTGQAQAMRHGIARALQHWDPSLRGDLKEAGLLTRDSRIVERKKPGLKKARKAFQWVKR